MDIILFGIYALVTFSFLPLFIVIMVKLKFHYPLFYEAIKWKVIFIFLMFILFVISRLFFYANLKLKIIQEIATAEMISVVPFYVTEIIITISLSYVLLAVS